MKIGIIIQETTAGLNTVYHTQSLSTEINNIDVLIEDERMLDAQLSNRENYFVVECKKDYKFYRLVSPTISDFTGRAGYYSITIVVQLKDSNQIVHIEEPCDLLKKIEFLYREIRNSNNPDYTQFEEFVASIMPRVNDVKYLDTPSKTILYQKINLQSNISIQMNTLVAVAVQKICFFSNSAVDDSHFEQNRYKKLSNDNSTYIKEISVDNNFNESFELYVNEKSYKLSKTSGFYVNSETSLSYKVQGEKSVQNVVGNRIRIERKQYVPKQEYSHQSQKKKSNALVYISSGIFIVGILGFFAYQYLGSEKQVENPIDELNPKEDVVNHDTPKVEYFEVLGDSVLKLKDEFIKSDILEQNDGKSLVMFKNEKGNINFRNGFSQNKAVPYDSTIFQDFVEKVFVDSKTVNKDLFKQDLDSKIDKLRPLQEEKKEIVKSTSNKTVKSPAKEVPKPIKPTTPKDEREN